MQSCKFISVNGLCEANTHVYQLVNVYTQDTMQPYVMLLVDLVVFIFRYGNYLC